MASLPAYDNPHPGLPAVQAEDHVDYNEVTGDIPTDSHALATAKPEEKGNAQVNHGDTEVRDLGWHKESTEVPNPLVGGLPNEELWTLVRRFNKQVHHVKSVPEPPLGGLDLNIADEEEFSPDKLRANIERLYMTVIVGSISFAKHIARLRSWRERNRTLAFLAVYSLAWALDFIVPAGIAFLLLLILYPPACTFCFPPAPIALINATTGGIKNPTAGVLGSDSSLTGAPEKHQGEAVEQEASNFVNAFTSIAISSAVGKGQDAGPGGKEQDAGPGEKESKLESVAPDPTQMTLEAADAKEKAAGGDPSAVHDKTKEPMSAAMWSKTRPVMHAIADVADGWERFGNALSPTPPFPQAKARLKLAAVLAPLLLFSLFTNAYLFMKASTFGLGLGFFGDPLIRRALDWLNRTYPDWQVPLQVRNTLLKGVPTDAQLTLTLLRIGEANKAPLPPPPSGGAPPPNAAHAGAGNNLEHLGASASSLDAAIQPTPGPAAPPPPKKRLGRRLLALFRGSAKGGVETMLGTDRLKAAAGAQHAKRRLGVVQSGPRPAAGPVEFPARWEGKRGSACIAVAATGTGGVLSWRTEAGKEMWRVEVGNIEEIKKAGGLGWKGKMVVAWATGREIADGLLIRDLEGREFQLTAMALREELFNRLIAIGNQIWEAW